MVCYICQKILTKQLLSVCCIYCHLTVLTPSVPYLCALSFKLAALRDKLRSNSITLTLCFVTCSVVYCTLLGCLGLTELVEEGEDHSLSWEQWNV